MGFEKLLKKEVKCQKCEIVLPKRDISIYDTTHQGQISNGVYMKVCNNCVMEMFYESLISFNEKAVVVAPIRGFNAYVNYNFDNLLKVKQDFKSEKENNENFVNDLIKLLPKDNAVCECCGSVSNYTWCQPELVNYDPFSWRVNHNSMIENKYLCSHCLINEFKKRIKDENVNIKVIYPPVKGNGLLCSWDV